MSESSDILTRPLGEVVRRWRRHRGLTLTGFAQRAGLSKGYVSQVENGRIDRPREKNLAAMAAALSISTWDLVSRRYPEERRRIVAASSGVRRSSTRVDASPNVSGALLELRQILRRAAELINDMEMHGAEDDS